MMKPFQDPDNTLTMMLLKTALGLIVAGGMAYGGWIYNVASENTLRIVMLEKAIISINDKLDVVVNDLKYHHKEK